MSDYRKKRRSVMTASVRRCSCLEVLEKEEAWLCDQLLDLGAVDGVQLQDLMSGGVPLLEEGVSYRR